VFAEPLAAGAAEFVAPVEGEQAIGVTITLLLAP
jgi:hypothetical protein